MNERSSGLCEKTHVECRVAWACSGDPRKCSGKEEKCSGGPRKCSGKEEKCSGDPRDCSGKEEKCSGGPRNCSGKEEKCSGDPQNCSGKEKIHSCRTKNRSGNMGNVLVYLCFGLIFTSSKLHEIMPFKKPLHKYFKVERQRLIIIERYRYLLHLR